MPEEIVNVSTVRKCNVCGTTQTTRWNRGLCSRCYQQAKNRVDRGIVSWEELVSMGIVSGEKKYSRTGSKLDELIAMKRGGSQSVNATQPPIVKVGGTPIIGVGDDLPDIDVGNED